MSGIGHCCKKHTLDSRILSPEKRCAGLPRTSSSHNSLSAHDGERTGTYRRCKCYKAGLRWYYLATLRMCPCHTTTWHCSWYSGVVTGCCGNVHPGKSNKHGYFANFHCATCTAQAHTPCVLCTWYACANLHPGTYRCLAYCMAHICDWTTSCQ